TQDRPEVCRRQPNFTMRNRMREICSSGSVRGGDGNVPTYSAQSMIADPELAGIVGDNDRVAQQAMMADRSPDASFPQHPDQRLVKDVDLSAHQVLAELQLVGKHLSFTRFQSVNKNRIRLAALLICKGGIIQNVVLIAAAQQREKVQPRLCRWGPKGGKMLAADLRRVAVAMRMPS